jgi:Ca2+-binding EF-hand superfamily protein
MPNTLKALAALGFLAASTTLYAEEAGSDARFKRLDTNTDGYVSRAEGKDAEELNTRFSELDVNNDGKLSRDEYAVLEREAREAAAKNEREQRASRRSSAAGGSK